MSRTLSGSATKWTSRHRLETHFFHPAGIALLPPSFLDKCWTDSHLLHSFFVEGRWRTPVFELRKPRRVVGAVEKSAGPSDTKSQDVGATPRKSAKSLKV